MLISSIAYAENNDLTTEDYELIERNHYIATWGHEGKKQEKELLKKLITLLSDFDKKTTFEEYREKIITKEQMVAFMSDFITDKAKIEEITNSMKSMDVEFRKNFDELKKITTEEPIDWLNVKVEGFERREVRLPVQELSKHYITGYVFLSVGDKYYRAKVLGFEHNMSYYLFTLTDFSPSKAGVTTFLID